MSNPKPSLDATKAFLKSLKLRDLIQELHKGKVSLNAPPKPNEIITIKTSTSVGDALKTLATYNILSAPVIDGSTSEYVGIFDIMDALKALLHQIYPELLADGFVESHKRLSMTELQAFGIEFGSHSVSSMLHGGDLWFKGDLETTAFELIEHGFRVGLPTRLHSPQHHLRVHHRVAVFDIVPGQQTPDGPVPEWHITDIISQTDLLRLLWAKMDILAPQDSAYDIQIAQLKAGLHRQTPELVSLSPDTPTLSALAKMHKAHVSGAAVVQHTPNGPLLGNLSASDLRGLTPERFGALALSVGAFLLYKHPKYGDDSVVKGNLTYEDALLDALPPEVKEGRWTEALAGAVQLVTCSESTTLGQIIELMVQHGVHRVYVCDPSTNSPTGVVTPTDVLRWILLY